MRDDGRGGSRSGTPARAVDDARRCVTGGGGFVGQWLARALLERGDDVDARPGIGASPATARSRRRRAPRDAVDRRPTCATQDDVRRAVDAARPDVVFHLAGVSFPSRRATRSRRGVRRQYPRRGAAARRRSRGGGRGRRSIPVVVVVGSATQYGRHDAPRCRSTKIAEQRPLDVYAASKAAQEVAALQAFRARRAARHLHAELQSFRASGTARSSCCPSLVRARAAHRASASARARDRQRRSVRDYLHVDDVVEAYLRSAERGRAGRVVQRLQRDGRERARSWPRDVLLRVGVTADITTDPALVRGRRRSRARRLAREAAARHRLGAPQDARRHHRRPDTCRDATDLHRILVIGSGPIVIGQAAEFDYSGTQATKALQGRGLRGHPRSTRTRRRS